MCFHWRGVPETVELPDAERGPVAAVAGEGEGAVSPPSAVCYARWKGYTDPLRDIVLVLKLVYFCKEGRSHTHTHVCTHIQIQSQ